MAPRARGHPAVGRNDMAPGGVVLLSTLSGCAAAVLTTVAVGFRQGGVVFTAVLLLAAVARGTMSPSSLGPMTVRSRAIDVSVLLVLSATIVVLAFVVPSA